MSKKIICPNCNKEMYWGLDGFGHTPWHLHCDNCHINIGMKQLKNVEKHIKEKIVATLEKLGRPALITEIQSANTELATYSNQKMSALLTQLVSANVIVREVDKKKAYFKINRQAHIIRGVFPL